MTYKPKRSELLPLFLGQPALMTLLVLAATLVLAILVGIGTAVYRIASVNGMYAFLPTPSVVHAAALFGIAFGLFNIACESADMDTMLRYRRPGLATYALVTLSLAFVDGSVQSLCGGTFVLKYASLPQVGLVATIIMAGVELMMLHSHFDRCRRDLVTEPVEN